MYMQFLSVFTFDFEIMQPDWELNPWVGTWTQPKPRLGLEPTAFQLRPHIILGINKAHVLDVLSQQVLNEKETHR